MSHWVENSFASKKTNNISAKYAFPTDTVLAQA